MDKMLDLLICRIPGLKAKEKIKLGEEFDKEEDLLILSKKDVEKFLGRTLKEPAWKMEDLRILAEKDAEKAHKLGINIVSWRNKNYPPLLREIYDPPALLFYRGFLPDPVKPLVAVVGTRKPSSQASKQAFQLGRDLGEAGIPVVSGLALGIDSMAHRGNTEAGAPTVAVLGSSPDMVYPVSNRFLAKRILETKGAILSEYPPGTGPARWNFPERNRIISALARGVVIVEAPEKSGALITARFALEQDRDVWVHSAGLSSKQGAGTVRLSEEGAMIVESAADILKEWKMNGHQKKKANGLKRTARGDGKALASSMADYLDIKL